jgi:hypothetical protein
MSSVLDTFEVSMKHGSDDCIPRRKAFSTPVIGAYRIPLSRKDLMPKHVHSRPATPDDLTLCSPGASATYSYQEQSQVRRIRQLAEFSSFCRKRGNKN